MIAAPVLQRRLGDKYKNLAKGAIGLYTYLNDRIGIGLKQLLAGSRKFRLDLIDRNDLMSLTERATKVTGIPMADECEKDLVEQILS